MANENSPSKEFAIIKKTTVCIIFIFELLRVQKVQNKVIKGTCLRVVNSRDKPPVPRGERRGNECRSAGRGLITKSLIHFVHLFGAHKVGQVVLVVFAPRE